MAPEQLRGGAAGPAADVFAFCVALYEALYGERPFPGRSLAELRKAVDAGQIRRTTTTHRSVPGRVRSILLLGLASDPDARPTMPELLAKLHEAQRERAMSRWAVPFAAAIGGALALGFATQWSRSSPVSVANVAHAAPEPIVEARPVPPPRAEPAPIVSAPAPSTTTLHEERPPPRKTSAAPAPVAVDASVAPPPIKDAGTVAAPPIKARALFDDPY
jgi:serine/threonine protein kinase